MARVVPFVMPCLADTSGAFSQILAAEQTAQRVQAWIDEKREAIRVIIQCSIHEDVPYHVIYPDIVCLEADIRGLKRMLEAAESSRRRWRNLHKFAWQKTLTPRKVDDLPHEILTMVFSNFEDVPTLPMQIEYNSSHGNLPRPDIASIKSIRLTCRAFCEAASRFLLPVVDVSFTEACAQHLEEVSHHPTISKGVRIIRVHVDAYRALLAHNIDEFCNKIIRKLSLLPMRFTEEASIVESEVTRECHLVGIIPKPKFFKIRGQDMILKDAQDLIGIVQRHMDKNSKPLDLFEAKTTNALLRTHKEYKRRYAEQKGLAKDFRMCSIISTAISMMPSVRRLCITSHGAKTLESSPGHPLDAQKWRTALRSSNPFLDMMVYTSSWYLPLAAWARDYPFFLALELPRMLQSGSRNLTHLDIEIPPVSKDFIKVAEKRLPDVRNACRRLEFVNIRVFRQASTDPKSLETTRAWLEAILVSPELQVVRLDLIDEEPEISIDKDATVGPLLASMSWDKLQGLHLAHFPIEVDELREVLGKALGRIHLDLDGIFLLKGTWAEALEILRGRADSSSRVVNPLGVEMEVLSGAETEDLLDAFDNEGRAGWYSVQRRDGPASFYIRGGDIPNPLNGLDG